MQFRAQKINLLFYTVALICENFYSFADTLVKDSEAKDLMQKAG